MEFVTHFLRGNVKTMFLLLRAINIFWIILPSFTFNLVNNKKTGKQHRAN